MKRILIVGVNWLGDAVMTTPVFAALKKKFPSSYIGIMTVNRVREVFDDNPYVDEVVIFDEKGTQKTLIGKLRFIRMLRKKRFDTVFLIHRSFTRALMCFLAGIKTRIGYSRPKNFFILTKKIKPLQHPIHRQDHYLHLFQKCQIAIDSKLPQVFIPDEISKKVRSSLKSIQEKHPVIIGVNVSANWELKRWPANYFAALCDSLIKDFNAAVIFIGAKKERLLINEVMKNMAHVPYDFCGKTTLKELMALIKCVKLFISSDSGPAHLAASLGVNTLAIFGPTSSEITSPRGKSIKIIQKSLDCETPCYKLDCKDNICMKNISVDEVYSQVKSALSLSK